MDTLHFPDCQRNLCSFSVKAKGIALELSGHVSQDLKLDQNPMCIKGHQ